MRAGAAIIVIIGVCLAALVLIERRMSDDIWRLSALVEKASNAQPVDENLETLQENLAAMLTWRFAFWIMDLVGVFLLGLLFFKVSQRKVRTEFTAPLPNDDFALTRRLAARDQYRFQFGILSLLALTLAVALICSATVYPIK